MTGLENPSHPLWATIRFLALVLAASFLLWKNANNFDETEIRTIVEIALVAGGYEGVMTMLRKKKPTQPEEQ